MVALNYKHFTLLIIMVLFLWSIIEILRILSKPLKTIRVKRQITPNYNIPGDTNPMVISGFNKPNYLWSMNCTPYKEATDMREI